MCGFDTRLSPGLNVSGAQSILLGVYTKEEWRRKSSFFLVEIIFVLFSRLYSSKLLKMYVLYVN